MDPIVKYTIARLSENVDCGNIKSEFARNYFFAIGRCFDDNNALATQLLYIACNLNSWRGQ